jgi:hypothetical protein
MKLSSKDGRWTVETVRFTDGGVCLRVTQYGVFGRELTVADYHYPQLAPHAAQSVWAGLRLPRFGIQLWTVRWV